MKNESRYNVFPVQVYRPIIEATGIDLTNSDCVIIPDGFTAYFECESTAIAELKKQYINLCFTSSTAPEPSSYRFQPHLESEESDIPETVDAMQQLFKSLDNDEKDRKKNLFNELQNKRAKLQTELLAYPKTKITLDLFITCIAKRFNTEHSYYYSRSKRDHLPLLEVLADEQLIESLIQGMCDCVEITVDWACEDWNNFQDFIAHTFGLVGIRFLFQKLGVGTDKIDTYFITPDSILEEQNEQPIEGHRHWYSLESIAKRWEQAGLTKDDILHRAETGELELCFDWRAAEFGGYFDSNPEFIGAVSPLIQFKHDKVVLHGDPRLSGFGIAHQYALVDSEGALGSFLKLSTESVRKLNFHREVTCPRAGINGYEFIYFGDSSKVKLDQIVVTCREVRRFEIDVLKFNKRAAEHMKSDNHTQNQLMEKNTTTSSYSTPWLEILTNAKEHFWADDRTRDPKKDTVVEWIKEEAVKRGLLGSDNIASAIFTIIKPIDHDPKKKRA